MSKQHKALRRAIRAAHLPESKLMINNKTGQIRRGWGDRAVYAKLKNASPEVQAAFIAGLKPMEGAQ
jgi:hypothetical protein